MNTKDKMFELLRMEELEDYFNLLNKEAVAIGENDYPIDSVATAKEAFDYAWEQYISGSENEQEIAAHLESYEKIMGIMAELLSVCGKLMCVIDLEENSETVH